MPDPIVIVARIKEIDPPVRREPGATAKAPETVVTIHFEDGQSARVVPGENAAALIDLFEDLRQLGSPAYVEADPAEQTVTRFLIPLVVQVTGVTAEEDHAVTVDLEPSHARFTLARDAPEFERMLEALLEAARTQAWQVVTKTGDHRLVDIRPLPEGGGKYVLPKPPALAERLLRFFFEPCARLILALRRIICHCFTCPGISTGCVGPSKAWDMYSLCASKSCDPVTTPAPCIPFLYPDDGCWGRAHEMCRLMIQQNVTPTKVWIYGSLSVDTSNNPNCVVNWGWHVAPVLCVSRYLCNREEWVIDPALFGGPVTKAAWAAKQNDPGATLVDTPWTIFHNTWTPQTDPTFVHTNQVLATYRAQLKYRSTLQTDSNGNLVGPPPYANCP